MKTVLVPLADDCEELEAMTITDILARAGAKVVTAGLKPGPVKASRGATLVPDVLLQDVQEQSFDLIALPGGLPGADHLAASETLLKLLKQQHAAEKLTAAVCAAPRALAAAGVLTGRRITCYPTALDHLNQDWTDTGAAVEVDGHIITGRGPGTALDFALTLVEQLFGRAQREAVEAPLVR